MKVRMKAAEEGRQSKLFLEHFNNIGETWEENFQGIGVYNSGQVQNIQHVATTAFNDYGKPAVAFFTPVLGKGIFSLDGAAWRHSRDLIKPIFSRSEVSDTDNLELHTDRFLDKIPGNGEVVDLQPLLHNFVTWEFTPFFGGPRVCPAQQQVLTQSVYLLVRMTRKFAKIENKDPVIGYVEQIRMVTESRNGVKVSFQ